MGIKKRVYEGNGEDCPKCSKPMSRFRKRPGFAPKPGQPFYFDKWDTCKDCSHVQHYEKFKVWCYGIESATIS